MATLPDLKDAVCPAAPSGCSTPRPDGPLAEALRQAAAGRASLQGVELSRSQVDDAAAIEQDIAALAREAEARDAAREALATALEWPQALEHGPRPAPWRGWAALLAAIVAAAAAAAVALLLSPAQAPTSPLDRGGLRMDPELSHPPAWAPARTARG